MASQVYETSHSTPSDPATLSENINKTTNISENCFKALEQPICQSVKLTAATTVCFAE